ncbi:capsular exopolysaccharide family [Alkalithermobacter thermoalcaliphilus JW-YL-7 = DSM 7308]|uniref:non-specific protein-tyrosine kinase n=1 Tax=Alkalithermobacter thermoalcaliphilus JW-YL-7 = DSM 7308 TaxID=1121328 RepID=A0A150FSI8_CLOPD|nr:capsular exopolysaccharide family [[Clostridium] paradoxum JW-YL-7 = DSM 7308]SHK69857.1 capsular exopolysaccharide family [[Clostridium] paradoxum JW-YL-7 = DSM 7308]
MQNIIVFKDPKSPISEAYRNIRTNILFSNIDENLQTILITSAGQSEGKSTTIANIAASLAELGKKIILLDCDFRRPSVHKKFNITNNKGITDILLNNYDYKDCIQRIVEGFDIITCGQIPPNPSEIISSNKLKRLVEDLKKDYEYILIDAPPVGIVSDAAILSTFIDGVILLASCGETQIEHIKKAKETLENVGAKILGVVLNKLEVEKNRAYGYYAYYYQDEENTKGKGAKNTKGKRAKKKK